MTFDRFWSPQNTSYIWRHSHQNKDKRYASILRERKSPFPDASSAKLHIDRTLTPFNYQSIFADLWRHLVGVSSRGGRGKHYRYAASGLCERTWSKFSIMLKHNFELQKIMTSRHIRVSCCSTFFLQFSLFFKFFTQVSEEVSASVEVVTMLSLTCHPLSQLRQIFATTPLFHCPRKIHINWWRHTFLWQFLWKHSRHKPEMSKKSSWF